MKKLMITVMLLAASAVCFAEEANTHATPKAEAPKVEAPKVAAPRAVRPKFDRAKFEERMKARKAEREAKVIEVLKKYGLDDEKAKACADELSKLRQRPPRMPARPQAPAEKKAE